MTATSTGTDRNNGCSWADEDTESLVLVADGTVVYPEGLRGLEVSDDRYPFGDSWGNGNR